MPYSFEGRAVEHTDLDRAFTKAQELLDRDAIALREFKDVYPDVADDEQWVVDMEQRFAEKATREPVFADIRKQATVLEAVIHSEGELSEWFGPYATTILSSAYDDYKNGVDEIVEFNDEEHGLSHLALAIDVVSGPELSKKVERIKEEIEHGTLTRVKYFQTADGSVRGPKENIPRVVIGVDRKSVRELGELWVNNDRKALAHHPAQFTLLEEMRSQLKACREYAKGIGRADLVSVYNEALHTIVTILKLKDPSSSAELLEDDEVFVALKSSLAMFTSEKKAA